MPPVGDEVTIGPMKQSERLTEAPLPTPAGADPLVAARRRARIRLLPLVAVVGALAITVSLNLTSLGNDASQIDQSGSTTTQSAMRGSAMTAPYSADLPSDGTNGTVSAPTPPAGSEHSEQITTSTQDGTSTKPSSGSTTDRPTRNDGTTPAGTASSQPRTPSNTWEVTPEPKAQQRSFDGGRFGDGALVGRDVAAGRYWSESCVGWKLFDGERLISRWNSHMRQSLVDIRAGETLLSNCRWTAGNPPASASIPTGKVSMITQLTPGRYRPVNEFCMSGPADTRSPDAIADSDQIITWESMPKDHVLVVTGSENWIAYGLGSDCGGFVRVN